MTYRHCDAHGDRLYIAVGNAPVPSISVRSVMRAGGDITAVDVPLSRVEELVAGIRDIARQAAARAVSTPRPIDPRPIDPAR